MILEVDFDEVCYYADIIENTFDCEYFGNIDVKKLWKEFKKNLNHQNILNVAWNKFPAGASYKDVKVWFEDEFNVLVKNDKVFLEE